MTLFRLLYRSDSALLGSAAAQRTVVSDIVAAGAERNAAAGLTGALLFAGGVFIQALEGEPGALEAIFERICCDLRHRHLRLLEFSETHERIFAPWPMVVVPPPRDLAVLSPRLDRSGPDAGSALATMALIRSLLGADDRSGTAAGGAARPLPHASAGAAC